jgi:cell division protein ZapA (FtsZ GTPase activity inhibitor)
MTHRDAIVACLKEVNPEAPEERLGVIADFMISVTTGTGRTLALEYELQQAQQRAERLRRVIETIYVSCGQALSATNTYGEHNAVPFDALREIEREADDALCWAGQGIELPGDEDPDGTLVQ